MRKGKASSARCISLSCREVAGYFSSLHRGFDGINVQNHIFFERKHRFYEYKKTQYFWEHYIQLVYSLAERQKNRLLKALLYSVGLFVKLITFPIYIMRFDVFIYAASYNYLPFSFDQAILKLFRKKIIVVTLGSDARPPYINGSYKNWPLPKLRKQTFKLYNHLKRKYNFADYIVDHMAVSQFNLQKKYIPFLYMGFPFDLNPCNDMPIKSNATIPLILHAPSNAEIKGTSLIREVVKELEKEGYDFKYEELINVPHSAVLKKLQECTFVINELYSDTLMAGLDTEAAWFGKPSIIGGYNLDGVEASIQGYPVPPTYRIHPNKQALKDAVIDLLDNEKAREDLGRRAYDYVHHYWNSKDVAMRYVKLIEGEVSESFFRCPVNDLDITGCGISDFDRRRLIKNYVEEYGEEALLLNHHSVLKAKILKDSCGDTKPSRKEGEHE